jgi:creatinine amidohydrolase/Fe(II)-dependent formamide hydrolase-like protein
MRKRALLTLVPLCLHAAVAAAQRPPDTVFLEALTWDEIRDQIREGRTSAIIATAGTEQKGPHMVMGQHRFILEHTTDRIARTLGNVLVAPIITYVPEGNLDPPSGHMRMAGTITLSNDHFMELLTHTAKSLEASGFTDIIFLGDSGGNQNGMRDVAAKLNAEWAGTGSRAHFIGDYYAKSADDAERYITQDLGIAAENIGGHAGMSDTSQMMAINMDHIRTDRIAPGGGFQGSGVSGDPTKASAELGARLLQFKIDNAVAQIRASLAAGREDHP